MPQNWLPGDIRDRIRDLCRVKNLKQSELAHAIGIDKSTFSRFMSGKLFWHLTEIDQAAQHRLDIMMPQLMKQRGITEELKSRDPMRWVAEMNAAKAQVEEIIFTELVYA